MDNSKSQLWPLHFVNGIDENTPILQYMDLDYLFQLLETKHYHINRKYTFEDPNEGVFPINRVIPVTAIGENTPPQPQQDVETCLKIWENVQKNKVIPTSCWTLNTSERVIMWKSYTSKYGACIKSTVGNIVASIIQNNYDIWCGKITYNGYYAQMGFIKNLFSKKPAFSDEEECRFYFFEYEQPQSLLPYIEIDVKPSVMIDEIILSPFIYKKAAEKIAQLIQNCYGIYNVNPSTNS